MTLDETLKTENALMKYIYDISINHLKNTKTDETNGILEQIKYLFIKKKEDEQVMIRGFKNFKKEYMQEIKIDENKSRNYFTIPLKDLASKCEGLTLDSNSGGISRILIKPQEYKKWYEKINS